MSWHRVALLKGMNVKHDFKRIFCNTRCYLADPSIIPDDGNNRNENDGIKEIDRSNKSQREKRKEHDMLQQQTRVSDIGDVPKKKSSGTPLYNIHSTSDFVDHPKNEGMDKFNPFSESEQKRRFRIHFNNFSATIVTKKIYCSSVQNHGNQNLREFPHTHVGRSKCTFQFGVASVTQLFVGKFSSINQRSPGKNPQIPDCQPPSIPEEVPTPSPKELPPHLPEEIPSPIPEEFPSPLPEEIPPPLPSDLPSEPSPPKEIPPHVPLDVPEYFEM